jgi:hypothetical protein
MNEIALIILTVILLMLDYVGWVKALRNSIVAMSIIRLIMISLVFTLLLNLPIINLHHWFFLGLTIIYCVYRTIAQIKKYN